jgi:glycosyltransferase involved in cell wall biosynthesis
MKIAIVTDTYFPRINGVSVSIDTFAGEYRKLGHEVYIIAPHYPGYRDKDGRVIRIKSHYMFFDPADRLSNPWLPSSSRTIKKKILSRKFDIIHTQTPFSLGISAMVWANKIKCPVIHTYHTLFESYVHYLKFVPQQISVQLARRISRWYCNRMDLVVAPTRRMKTLLTEYKVRKPIEVVPTGIKLEMPACKAVRSYLKKYPGLSVKRNLLFMGRLEREKNIDFLFYVLKKLLKERDDVKLVLAGSGMDASRLKALVKAMGLSKNVLFLGSYKDADRICILSTAELFVFSSLTETQGLVVLEALSSGLPVVAVNKMGVAEVMEGNRGGILTELNVDAFAKAVNRMLDDKVFYAKKKKEACAHAKEWASGAMAAKMLHIYKKAIEEYKRKNLLRSKKKSSLTRIKEMF